jgi:hypothetical protein
VSSPYDQNPDVVKALVKVVQQVSENADLTPYLKPTSISENLKDLHERLLFVRGRQQRVSELVGTLIRIQANVRKLVLDRKSQLESAEAKAAAPDRTVFQVEDYSSARERNAKLTAKTLDERVALTAAQKLQIDADAALDYAQNAYRDLGNQAFDVSTRIKVLGMEGTLG